MIEFFEGGVDDVWQSDDGRLRKSSLWKRAIIYE
jgi:hypothetical protein